MMSNYGRTQELLNEATNSNGKAQEQFEKTLESLEVSVTKLHNAWQSFTMSIANNEVIKVAIKFLTDILSAINNVSDSLFGQASGIAKVVGLFLTFKLVRPILKGIFIDLQRYITKPLGDATNSSGTFSKGFIDGLRNIKNRTPGIRFFNRQDVENQGEEAANAFSSGFIKKLNSKQGQFAKDYNAVISNFNPNSELAYRELTGKFGSVYDSLHPFLGKITKQRARTLYQRSLQLTNNPQLSTNVAFLNGKERKELASLLGPDMYSNKAQVEELLGQTGLEERYLQKRKLKQNLVATGVLAAIGVAKTLINNTINAQVQAQQRSLAESQKVIDKDNEEIKTIKEKQIAYQEALENYSDTTTSKAKYREATLAVADALGIEISMTDILNGNLTKISKTINEAALAKGEKRLQKLTELQKKYQDFANERKDYADYWSWDNNPFGSAFSMIALGIDTSSAYSDASQYSQMAEELQEQIETAMHENAIYAARAQIDRITSVETAKAFEEVRKQTDTNYDSADAKALLSEQTTESEKYFLRVIQYQEDFSKRLKQNNIELDKQNSQLEEFYDTVLKEGKGDLLPLIDLSTVKDINDVKKKYEELKQIEESLNKQINHYQMYQVSNLLKQGNAWESIDETLRKKVLLDLTKINGVLGKNVSAQKEFNYLLNFGTKAQQSKYLLEANIKSARDERLNWADENIKKYESNQKEIEKLLGKVDLAQGYNYTVANIKSDELGYRLESQLAKEKAKESAKTTGLLRGFTLISAGLLGRQLGVPVAVASDVNNQKALSYERESSEYEAIADNMRNRSEEYLKELKSYMEQQGDFSFDEIFGFIDLDPLNQDIENLENINAKLEKLGVNNPYYQKYINNVIDFLEVTDKVVTSSVFSTQAIQNFSSSLQDLAEGNTLDFSDDTIKNILGELPAISSIFDNAYEEWEFDTQYWASKTAGEYYQTLYNQSVKTAAEVSKNQKDLDQQLYNSSKRQVSLASKTWSSELLKPEKVEEVAAAFAGINGLEVSDDFESVARAFENLTDEDKEQVISGLTGSLKELLSTDFDEFINDLKTIDELSVKLEKTDYGMKMAKEVFDAATSSADLAISKFDKLANAIQKVGENFVISASDAKELAAAYPEILKGATYLSDGTVQLNQESVNAVIEGQKSKIEGEREVALAQLETAKSDLDTQINLKQAQLKLLQDMAESKKDYEQKELDFSAEASDKLVEILKDNGLTTAQNQEVVYTIMTRDEEKFHEYIAGSSGSAQAFMQQLYDNYGKFIAGETNALLSNINDVMSAYATLEKYANGEIDIDRAIDTISKIHVDYGEIKGLAPKTYDYFKENVIPNYDESENKINEFKSASSDTTLPQSDQLQKAIEKTKLELQSLLENRERLTGAQSLINLSYNNLLSSFGSAASGLGGEAFKNKWENTFNQLYNLLQKIKYLEEQGELLEEEYNELLKDRNATKEQILENREKALLNAEQQKAAQESKKNASLQFIKNLYAGNEDLAKYVQYDEATNLVSIDYGKINQITSEAEGKRVTKFYESIQEYADNIADANKGIKTANKKLEEIKEAGRSELIDLQNRISDALKNERQKEIDKLSEIDESIKTANQDLINSIKENLSTLRQNRQNSRTEEELNNKRLRLLYMQQRTDISGSSKELLELQKDVAQSTENFQDTLIDQRIDQLQKSNDKAAEQREAQITHLKNILEADIETGNLTRQAEDILEKSFNKSDGSFNISNDVLQLLKDNEGWTTMTNAEQEVWLEKVIQSSNAAYGFNELPKVLKDLQQNIDEGLSVTIPEIAIRINSDGTTNVDTVGSEKISLDYTPINNTLSDIKKGSAQTSKLVNWTKGMTDKQRYVAFQTLKDYWSGSNNYDKTIVDLMDNETDGLIRDSFNDTKKQETIIKLIQNGTLEKLSDESKGKALEALNSYWYYPADYQYSSKYQEWVQVLDNGTGGLIKDSYVDKELRNYIIGILTNQKKKYATGGIVNFTGPAWLDGTYSNPEYVLDNTRLQNLITLLNLQRRTLEESNMLSKTQDKVANFEINVHVDKVDSDYDIHEIVNEVKNEIVRIGQYRNINVIGY